MWSRICRAMFPNGTREPSKPHGKNGRRQPFKVQHDSLRTLQSKNALLPKEGRGELFFSKTRRLLSLKSLNPYPTAASAAMATLPDFDVETRNLGALLAFSILLP